MITISEYNFEGPFTSTSALNAQSGVYAILGKNGDTGWFVVDVGVSDSIKSRIENHGRKQCWQKQYNQLACAALYTDEESRLIIEKQIRQQYSPPCGER